MLSIKFNPSYKYHFWIAVLIGIWLAFFLVVIAPFDIAELPFSIRLYMMPVYGVISMLGYLILIPLQKWIFEQQKSWTILYEILFVCIFNIIVLLGSYIYYQSSIVNGAFSFSQFTLSVYTPIFFIVLPMLLVARWLLNNQVLFQGKIEKIALTGENRMDVLQINYADLISVSSADNYVEITYLVNDTLAKKLLRSTLKNIHLEVPDLVKVHRSHLINANHFVEWKNTNTLLLTQMEIPISKTYKQTLLAMDNSPLKPNRSPQT